MVCGHTIKMGMFAKNKLDPNIFEFLKFGRQTKIAARLIFKREYLVNILIMPKRHFHFHSVFADRLQDGPGAWSQLRIESAAWALLKC